MPTNEIKNPRYRQRLFGGPSSSLPEDLPEWLRSQFSQNQVGEGGGMEYLTPGATLTDAQGRRVTMLDDSGGLMDPRNLAWNEGTDPTAARRWDEDLGWVTDAANVNETPWESRHRQNQIQAAAMFAALAGGGLAAEAGMFGGASGASGGGFPMVEAPNMAIPGAIPAANPAMSGLPSLAGGAGGTAGAGAAAAGAGGSGGTGLAGLGQSISGGVSSLGDYITSNPMGALRTGTGLASLGASMRGGSSDGNAVGSMSDILDQQATANRYNWNTPTGSRSWQRGPDGQFTVTDALSPEEQANYENVRTLNADSTGYARDLLARTMAAPRRDYAGSLPSTDSYFQRWRG